jgi:hypothetical protein
VIIEVLDKAENDLVEGYLFYEAQGAGLGEYFLESLYSDLESLRLYAGIHRVVYRNYYRLLSKRFPFAVFYTMTEGVVRVQAVVDCRRNPVWIREHLQ